MDKISFKGIQNAGVYHSADPDNSTHMRLIFQLNDEDAKDFSMSRDIFEKFPDRDSRRFLRIDENISMKSGEIVIDNFFINGKLLEAKEENSNLFVKLYALINKIWENSIIDRDLNQHVKLPITPGYFDSLECLSNYNHEKQVISNEVYYKRLKNYHDPVHVEAISAMLMQYLKANIKIAK